MVESETDDDAEEEDRKLEYIFCVIIYSCPPKLNPKREKRSSDNKKLVFLSKKVLEEVSMQK